MKSTIVTAILCASALLSSSAIAKEAANMKQAKKATELRQSVYKLVASNLGPMGAMARGKIPFNQAVVEKNSMRINQLGFMMADYLKLDTRKFNVETEALDKIWQQPKDFNDKIQALITASANLQDVAKQGDEKSTKKAIGKLAKTCGGCHDVYKKD